MLSHSRRWPTYRHCEIHRPYHEARNLTVRFEKQLNAMFGAATLSAGGRELERGKAAGRGWHEAER
jgi:hypothetical protein